MQKMQSARRRRSGGREGVEIFRHEGIRWWCVGVAIGRLRGIRIEDIAALARMTKQARRPIMRRDQCLHTLDPPARVREDGQRWRASASRIQPFNAPEAQFTGASWPLW